MSRPPHLSRTLSRTLVPLALVPLLAAGGCYRRLSYDSPEGRKLEVVNLGFNTEIGSLTAETPDGSVAIEGAASSAAVASKIADLAAHLAKEAK